MVADALQSATSEGGRFHDMNERLKDSASGQWSKMQSDVQLLATEIGTNLLPAAKSFMNLMNSGSTDGKGGLLSMLMQPVINRARDFSTGAELINAIGSDAAKMFSNSKDRTSAVGGLWERLQEEQARANNEGFIHKKTPEERARAEANMFKREADKKAKEVAEFEAIAKKEKAASEYKKQLENETLEAEKKAAKDKQKEIDRLSKHFEDIHNKRLKEAAELEKATLTPLQEYEKELARISELSMFGAISDEIAKLGKDKAGQKLISQANAESKKSDPLSISQTIAPALKAGSVEAYKFMLQQKDKLYEAAQQQTELSTQTLEVAKQQLAATQAIPKIGVKR
jgi:hypothetical protein